MPIGNFNLQGHMQNQETDPNDPFSTRPLGQGFGLGDYYRQIQANIAQGLLDPQSQFYQNFRSFLGSATPSPGANSFLSLLQAGGGNMGASQVQAQQMQRGAEGRRNDFLNTATKGFAGQNIGLGLQALGQAQGSDLQQQGIVAQKDATKAQQGGFLDFLGNIFGVGAAGLTGGLFGSGGGGFGPDDMSAPGGRVLMADKLFSPNVGKNFGEAFLSTIDRERKLRQDQQQFNQSMAFKERQLNFIDAYRNSLVGVQQGNLDARNREQDFREIPPPSKPITETSLEPLFGGMVEVKREDGKVIDYGSHYKQSKTETEEEKTPLYDLSGSGKAFNEYREFESTMARDETGDYDVLGEKNLISGSQVRGLKQAKLQAVKDATDNEARKITQKVPNFYGSFQRIMGGVGKGLKIKSTGEIIQITKDNIDKVVNKLMKNESSETRDAMKTLLKRRIF